VADFPKISLVLGGVSSGKSAFAEGLTRSAGLAKIYMATARAQDTEMADKIARHQRLRGSDWQLIEEPLDLATALASIKDEKIVLLDCLSLWLTNHIMEGSDLTTNCANLLGQLAGLKMPVVMVSNEVGLGGIGENPLARRFQVEQGRLNQKIAAIADLVIMVNAGLPTALKGTLPMQAQ